MSKLRLPLQHNLTRTPSTGTIRPANTLQETRPAAVRDLITDQGYLVPRKAPYVFQRLKGGLSNNEPYLQKVHIIAVNVVRPLDAGRSDDSDFDCDTTWTYQHTPTPGGTQSKDSSAVKWLTDDDMLLSLYPGAQIWQFAYRLKGKTLTLDNYDVLAQAFIKALEKEFVQESIKDSKISQASQSPLSQINGESRAQEPQIPILIIAYSEAGLIIEKAFVALHEKDETNEKRDLGYPSASQDNAPLTSKSLQDSVFKQVAGVIFLGPANDASDVLGEHIKDALCRSLSDIEKKEFENFNTSLSLYYLSDSFATANQTQHLSIWCFTSEDQELGVVRMFSDVDDTSCLDRKYSELCRFSGPDDSEYRQVLQKMWLFISSRQFINVTGAGIKKDVDVLHTSEVNIDSRDFNNRTALHNCVKQAGTKNSIDMINWLLENGADVGARDINGDTPLHLAAQSDDSDTVQTLLEFGANPKTRNFSGQSPRSIARNIAKDDQNETFWTLCNPPFHLGPSNSTKKFPGTPATLSRLQINACKMHTINSAEFFRSGGGFATARCSVYKMIYSGLEDSTPAEILRRAVINARKNKDRNSSNRINVEETTAIQELSFSTSVCKWYHIPANNLSWIQDFFIKIRLDVPLSEWLRANEKSYEVFQGYIPPIQPFSKAIKASHVGNGELREDAKVYALCMPYLDYGSMEGYTSLTKAIRNANMTAFFERLRQRSPEDAENESIDSDFEDDDRDENGGTSRINALLSAYWLNKLPVLSRNTLDRYHYHMLPDVEARDRDQVVYRLQRDVTNRKYATKKHLYFDDKKRFYQDFRNLKMVMVDQIFLWYIPKSDTQCKTDILLSNFSEQLQKTNSSHASLLDKILKLSGRKSDVSSALNLMSFIVSKCVEHFSEAGLPHEGFTEMFERAVNMAMDEETKLFHKFKEDSRKLKEMDRPSRIKSTALHEIMDIGQETELFLHVKDVQDEVNMIVRILEQQHKTLEEFTNQFFFRSNPEMLEISKAKQVIRDNEQTFKNLGEQATKVQSRLDYLLDLKHRHVNLWEARFARETGEENSRQGRTLLIFTVVTIVFLPLSFLASFMALNIKEFPTDPSTGNTSWPLSSASSYIFGISVALSVPLILIALTFDYMQKSSSDFMSSLPREYLENLSIMQKCKTVTYFFLYSAILMALCLPIYFRDLIKNSEPVMKPLILRALMGLKARLLLPKELDNFTQAWLVQVEVKFEASEQGGNKSETQKRLKRWEESVFDGDLPSDSSESEFENVEESDTDDSPSFSWKGKLRDRLETLRQRFRTGTDLEMLDA